MTQMNPILVCQMDQKLGLDYWLLSLLSQLDILFANLPIHPSLPKNTTLDALVQSLWVLVLLVLFLFFFGYVQLGEY